MADDTSAKGGDDTSKKTEAENTEETKAATAKAAEERTDADIEAIADQAKKPDAVKRALQAERDAAKSAREELEAARAEVKKYQDKDKTEKELLEGKATEAEARASAAEAKLLKVQVAAEKKLPADLADRLQGKNKKELESDADRLLELVKPEGERTVDVDAGKGAGTGGEDFNAQIRQQAGVR